MSARRPVAVLLSLQAVALLLLTTAATATWWNERATVGAEVDSIQRRAREIRGQAAIAALEPYAYGSDRDPKHIAAAEEAVARARGLVDSLAQDMPAQAPAFVNMGEALADMTEVCALPLGGFGFGCLAVWLLLFFLSGGSVCFRVCSSV